MGIEQNTRKTINELQKLFKLRLLLTVNDLALAEH